MTHEPGRHDTCPHPRSKDKVSLKRKAPGTSSIVGFLVSQHSIENVRISNEMELSNRFSGLGDTSLENTLNESSDISEEVFEEFIVKPARIAAANAEQAEVVAHIQAIEGFASNEHLLAGRGLERLDHALNNRQDRTASQIMTAAGNGDKTAISVAQMQARFAGSVYGDMALANLPFGGLYLIGGVARALEPYLSSDIFAHSFRDKGRFGPFNEQFSVHLVLDDFAALKGCASYIMARAF